MTADKKWASTLGSIKRNLANFDRRRLDDSNLGQAAVVIVIVPGEGPEAGASIILTRRATTLRKHSGQFALPGGRVDPGETSREAALRELHEELGLDLGEEAIIGLLDDYPTRSGFRITPVVAWVDADSRILPNPSEVANVFHIPLSELERDNLTNFDPGEQPDRPVFSINLPTIGHEVYAPTAAMIYQFYEVAVRGREVRVAHFDEPRFAWR